MISYQVYLPWVVAKVFESQLVRGFCEIWNSGKQAYIQKSLRSLLPSPKYFAEKVRKSRQQNFATKVRKSWNKAKIYKKVGLLTTFLRSVGESETKNMFIRHLWRFFTTLWHIFKAIALPDKIEQSRFGSFCVLRL